MKWLKLILLAVVIQTSIPASAYDFEVDGIYYNIVSLSDLTAEITKGDTGYTFETFSIPETVTFNGRTLSIVKIGASAFSSCVKLSSITIPESVTSIGEYAFYGCSSLTSVTIPESVTSIGTSAFYFCGKLTSITIPSSVTSIGSSAFDHCSGLKKVIVKDLAAWCGISFGNNASSNPLYYAKHLYSDEDNEITDLQIPDGVTRIGAYAFQNCSSLTSVTIPQRVSIAGDAFSNCDNLDSIMIQGSIQSLSTLGAIVFYKCAKLNFVQISNNVDSIDNYVFDTNSSEYKEIIIDDCEKALYLGYTERVHPTYSSYYYGCFYSGSLEKVYLGRNLEFLDKSGKYGSDYYYEPFGAYNSKMKELYIGDYVTSLDGLSLSNHKNLETLTIGKGLSEVPNLKNHSKLTSLTLNSEVPQAASEFTNAQYLNLNVYVPKGSLAAYQSADVWKNFWNLQETVTADIGNAISNADTPKEVKRYDGMGREMKGYHKGLNIIKMSDGTTKKVIIK